MIRPPSQPLPGPRRILVVEDEPGIQRAVRLVIEDWETLPAMNLAEARARLAAPETFDVALIDKNLPDGSGLELARELRERRPEVAVILMTAYPTMESAIEAVATGVFDYMPKPFDASALQLKVSNAGERVRLEREHKRMQDRVHRGETLELVGQLAGGFAHDFNNLLVVLYAAVDQLQPIVKQIPGTPGDTAQEWLAEIKATSARAADLSRRMLGMSKQPVGAREIVDLNAAIADARVLLDRTIEANINVEIIAGADVPNVAFGRGALEQVLLNLAINARDAMPSGGTLTIETVAADGRARLTVTDTGSGMPPEVARRIFEAFYTTKGPTKGTGLGLATVQRLVTDAGGTIAVSSTPGQGTTFTVELPACADRTGRTRRITAEQATRGKGEGILLVEDQPAVRASVTRMLTFGGYQVTAAATVAEARAAARSQAYAVIVSDVMLPDGNGIELIAELTRAHPDMRAVCISGYGAEGVGMRGTPTEGVRFLAKPFTSLVMLGVLREVLER
jgi:two-component system cell cycle sensor histidine kinase/response regulator CckA